MALPRGFWRFYHRSGGGAFRPIYDRFKELTNNNIDPEKIGQWIGYGGGGIDSVMISSDLQTIDVRYKGNSKIYSYSIGENTYPIRLAVNGSGLTRYLNGR